MKEFKKKKNDTKEENASVKRERVDALLNSHLGMMKEGYGKYKEREPLGEGSYAKVQLAIDKSFGDKVALKIYEKNTLVVKRRLENLIVC